MNKTFTKITVIGLGYVGLGQATLFNTLTNVCGYDIDEDKIHNLRRHKIVINDNDIKEALKQKPLVVTNDFTEAVSDSNLVIIATPTNFLDATKAFDLSSVTQTLAKLAALSFTGVILVKSTLYVGGTAKLQDMFPSLTIMFSPEFLREGHALFDNYYPSRIIISYDKSRPKHSNIARKIGLLYQQAAKNDAPLLLMGTAEAEAIKLFSNTYLALRVAFFNELDTYALTKGLDTKSIIEGVGLDPRIGNFYNNPSFGYGGYCLPKDTKELNESFALVPQNLISASISANATRKAFISDFIIQKLGEDYQEKTVGIYRLTMKKDASNMRESSTVDVMLHLVKSGVNVVIYEPLLHYEKYENIRCINDLSTFKTISDLIITNRLDDELKDVMAKVFTRDLFNKD